MDKYDKRAEEIISLMDLQAKIRQLHTTFPNGDLELGIPHLGASECLHGMMMNETTSFPQAIALGGTWDPDLVEEIARTIAKEGRATGVQCCYSPMLAVARDARWGRVEESYGEDPYLVSRIGAAFVRGLQGKGDDFLGKESMVACAKHFVADGEPRAGLNGQAVEISERTLREIHLAPFKACLEEAGLAGIMPAHHSVNGVPCHGNVKLLKHWLREENGFDGIVVTDNRDINCMHTLLHTAETPVQAAKTALEAGVDQELSWLGPWDERLFADGLIEAVEKGEVPESLIDEAVRRVLRIKLKLGLFESDPVQPKQDIRHTTVNLGERPVSFANGVWANVADTPWGCNAPKKNWREITFAKAHDGLAKKAALKSLCLLKNREDLLPLDKNSLNRLAVIGPNADAKLLGRYSTRQPKYVVSVLEGVENYLSGEVIVDYAEGCSIKEPDKENIKEAVKTVEKADAVLLVVGGDETTCRENEDRDSLRLVGHQHELIREIHKTGTPVILLVLAGRPLSLVWEKENIPAILWGWYLGQEGGSAVADVLFGKYNPGARLPMTIPRSAGQCPAYYNALPPGRAGKYYREESTPLWPFGHGLNYTDFKYGLPCLSRSTIGLEEAVKLTVPLENRGDREGEEIIQIYVRDRFSSLTRPERELKGFQRVSLKKGESREILFTLDTSAFSFYHEEKGGWIVEPGDFDILVGSSSECIRHELVLTITG